MSCKEVSIKIIKREYHMLQDNDIRLKLVTWPKLYNTKSFAEKDISRMNLSAIYILFLVVNIIWDEYTKIRNKTEGFCVSNKCAVLR